MSTSCLLRKLTVIENHRQVHDPQGPGSPRSLPHQALQGAIALLVRASRLLSFRLPLVLPNKLSRSELKGDPRFAVLRSMASLNLEALETFLRSLSSLLAQKTIFDLVSLCIKAFYLLSALAILIVRLVPELRNRFLDYGARGQVASGTTQDPKRDEKQKLEASSIGLQLLDVLEKLTVPHSWFIHFYILAVGGSLLQFQHDVRSHMSPPALVASGAFLLQGCRRLLECLLYNRQSKSRMWVGHYVIGLAFYFFTNLAIFIDGVDWVNYRDETSPNRGHNSLQSVRFVFVYCFLHASYRQAILHRYLFKLKKYTLPNEHGFTSLIAPHYTAECVLYGALAVIAAPPGSIINWNLVCALIFVAVNLGVTADGTKRWMLSKFPDRRIDIERRWNLIAMLW